VSVRHASRFIAVLVLALLGSSHSAHGSDSPSDRRAQARIAHDSAQKAAGELRFADALAGYRLAMELDPTAPFIKTARVRAADLQAHSEGGFMPLARLETVRRDARKSTSRTEIEGLERDLAAFPDGRVRSEARLLVADAWQYRLGEPERATGPLQDVLADHSSDELSRTLALSKLVALHRGLGRLDDARRTVERWPDVAPAVRAEVMRLVRRERLRWASVGLLSVLAAVGAVSLARVARGGAGFEGAVRKVVRPLAVAIALYVGAAAAVLARLHGGGDPRPFLWLGLGILGVGVIARAWAIASSNQTAAARSARALACAACVLAAAFLSLERADAGYLESFGL
jgi:hypothetical protein